MPCHFLSCCSVLLSCVGCGWQTCLRSCRHKAAMVSCCMLACSSRAFCFEAHSANFNRRCTALACRLRTQSGCACAPGGSQLSGRTCTCWGAQGRPRTSGGPQQLSPPLLWRLCLQSSRCLFDLSMNDVRTAGLPTAEATDPNHEDRRPLELSKHAQHGPSMSCGASKIENGRNCILPCAALRGAGQAV